MKVGVLFPGYGSQFVGMGKEFYDEFRIVQEYFEEASNCLDTNFVKLCFAASDQELAEVTNAYPAIFLLEVALYQVLRDQGVPVDQVAGMCIGRYAALFAAGGFSFPDGLYLLKKYTQFYLEALTALDPKIIRVTGLSLALFKRVYAQFSTQVPATQLQIDTQYSKTDLVIAGPRTQVELFEQLLANQKIKDLQLQNLSLAHDLHGPLMVGVAERLSEYLVKVDFKDLKLAYFSGMSGKLVQTSKQVRAELINQITKPILWPKVQAQFRDCDLLIEVGPSPVLSADLRALYPTKTVLSLTKRADLETIKQVLAESSNSTKNTGELEVADTNHTNSN